MDVSLKTQCMTEWTSALECVDGAVVFLDPKGGECIHWSVGTCALMYHGALAIHDFNAYQFFSDKATQNAEKAVFISPRLITDIQVDLCDILSQSCFRKVFLIISPVPDSPDGLSKLRQDILQWMAIGTRVNIQELYVKVIHFPFFIAPLTESVITLPCFRDMPLTTGSNKFSSLGGKSLTLSSKEQGLVEHLAVCLDSLLSEINAADVLFSLGPLSSAVGSALEGLMSSQQRRKVARHRISVLLVDRSLDLCTPTSVDSKCFLDKILGALPHLPDHSIDVAVNMSLLAQATVDSPLEQSIFPGCLAHHSIECVNIINTLIQKNEREILLEMHQLFQSKTSGSKVLRVRPDILEKDIRHFRGNFEEIREHCGTLQVASAVVQTLAGEHAEEVALRLSVERVLCQNIATSQDGNELIGLLTQVTKLVAERHIRGQTLDSLLTLLVLVYSLIGSDVKFPVKDEVQLQAAISTAMFEDQEFPGIVHAMLAPLECSKEKIDGVTANVFAALKSISHARRNLINYKSILRRQGSSLPFKYVPLLHQLFSDVLDPSEPAIPDLVCHSSGLKDLLRSGFSMLLNKQKTLKSQHPAQQPNLLVFVLGGITGGEIKYVQEAWATSPNGKSGGALLVASSCLLSPTDTLQAVLKSTQSI